MRSRYGTSFSVKLSPADMAFLDDLRLVLGKNTLADALRDGLGAFRTLFALPSYQVERLRVDMQTRGLNRMQYVQELLAQKYQQLARPQSEEVEP